MSSAHGVTLLAYADRLGGNLPGLKRILDGPLRAFSDVQVLPFFMPFDGADAGFDPIDHATVDPRLGDGDDIRALADGRTITADLIVHHVSTGSFAGDRARRRSRGNELAATRLRRASTTPNRERSSL